MLRIHYLWISALDLVEKCLEIEVKKFIEDIWNSKEIFDFFWVKAWIIKNWNYNFTKNKTESYKNLNLKSWENSILILSMRSLISFNFDNLYELKRFSNDYKQHAMP